MECNEFSVRNRFEMVIMPIATPNWFRSNYTSIGKQMMFNSDEQIRCVHVINNGNDDDGDH